MEHAAAQNTWIQILKTCKVADHTGQQVSAMLWSATQQQHNHIHETSVSQECSHAPSRTTNPTPEDVDSLHRFAHTSALHHTHQLLAGRSTTAERVGTYLRSSLGKDERALAEGGTFEEAGCLSGGGAPAGVSCTAAADVGSIRAEKSGH